MNRHRLLPFPDTALTCSSTVIEARAADMTGKIHTASPRQLINNRAICEERN